MRRRWTRCSRSTDALIRASHTDRASPTDPVGHTVQAVTVLNGAPDEAETYEVRTTIRISGLSGEQT